MSRTAPAVAQPCGRSPGRPRDEEATRAIHEAALRLLADHGYAGITMERVAAEAGVSRATVYRRYRDKADVVTAAVAADLGELPAQPSHDPRRALVRFLEAFDARFASPCLAIIGTMLGGDEDPRGIDLHRERVIGPRAAYARSLLSRAQELGQLDAAADLDLALHMLVGAVFARRVHGQASDRAWARRAVDTVWRGMAPSAARHG